MDFWVVAAAAAAGYFSKYWKNHSRDRDCFPVCSSEGLGDKKPEAHACPFHWLEQQRKIRDISADRKGNYGEWLDTYQLDGSSGQQVQSDSLSGHTRNGDLASYSDSNVLLFSNLGPRLTSDNLDENEFEIGSAHHFGSDSGKSRNGRVDNVPGFLRNRCFLKSRRLYGNSVKPLSSLESCVMAQLYKEHARMEEYVLSFVSPSTPTIRPFIVTDGSRIISRANGNFLYGSNAKENKLHKEANVEENNYIYGIPPLPKISSTALCKEMKLKRGKVRQTNDFCRVVTQKLFNSQGLQDDTVLFCFGISIGMITSFIANKKEVDKLSGLLKRTENLVQDLQDELEMKDSMMVKELAYEDHESKELDNDPSHDNVSHPFSPKYKVDNSEKYNDKESYYENVEQISESMCTIEAELEAELERLGLNMNASNLERKVSDFVELDPDFVADFAQGELRADMLKGHGIAQTVSDQNSSGAFTTHYGNYAVSPQELSLRLHEVIESRLEERVAELETALENSQRKLKLLESRKNYRINSFNNELRYMSDEKHLVFDEECNSMDHPLVMNLSGEALDAYNEAYEELTKINDSEEEDSSTSKRYGNTSQQGLHLFHGSTSPDQNDNQKGHRLHFRHETGRMSEETLSGMINGQEEHPSRYQELLDIGVSEEESSGSEDEMEKQLIKQIVERTKRGSPVVLNAQKILFSMEENE